MIYPDGLDCVFPFSGRRRVDLLKRVVRVGLNIVFRVPKPYMGGGER